MKPADLIAIVESRGLKIVVDDRGRPAIRETVSNAGAATPALMDAIKAHRYDILAYLGLEIPSERKGDEQAIECLWPGNNFVGRHWFPEKGWPTGAYFWRLVGGAEWKAIPGRIWDADKHCGTTELKNQRVNVESLFTERSE